MRCGNKIWGWLLGLGAVASLADAGRAQTPAQVPALNVERAVMTALQNNPDLAVARKNLGIAQAGIVIARTYPFNPVWQQYVFYTGGPASAGITGRVSFNENVRLDLELRGQGQIRQGAAQAALSRVEWEVAGQELLVAVRTVRAYQTLAYRQDKVRVLEDMVRVQEEVVSRVTALEKQGLLKPADKILAEVDLAEARAAIAPARALQVAAWTELRRVLGVEGAMPPVQAALEPVPDLSADGLEQLARQRRPDLHALEMVIVEADQRVRLEIANRFGNPSIGPSVNYNETRVYFMGAWILYQLPVLNTRRGDILQRQAERDRAVADAHRLGVQIGYDVEVARERLGQARQWVEHFTSDTLPALKKAAEKLEELFKANEVGVLQPLDAQRRLLRARDSYLDALWELHMARADLVAAVGDLNLIVGTPAPAAPCPAPPGPPVRQLPPPAPVVQPVQHVAPAARPTLSLQPSRPARAEFEPPVVVPPALLPPVRHGD